MRPANAAGGKDGDASFMREVHRGGDGRGSGASLRHGDRKIAPARLQDSFAPSDLFQFGVRQSNRRLASQDGDSRRHGILTANDRFGAVWLACAQPPAGQGNERTPELHRQEFASDPKWESYRSRLLSALPRRRVRQAFGWSRTGFAHGRSLGDHRSRLQAVDAVADRHHHVNLVLDQQDADAPFAGEFPDQIGELCRFMVIEQAMGTPKGREAGVRYMREFVEEMKASGFVANALKASNQLDAAVAPPTPVR